MIRFSASLVVIAMGLLVAGGVTSKLLLVYVAIALSVVALIFLITGAILHRGEFRARPSGEAAGPAAGTAAGGDAQDAEAESAALAGAASAGVALAGLGGLVASHTPAESKAPTVGGGWADREAPAARTAAGESQDSAAGRARAARGEAAAKDTASAAGTGKPPWPDSPPPAGLDRWAAFERIADRRRPDVPRPGDRPSAPGGPSGPSEPGGHGGGPEEQWPGKRLPDEIRLHAPWPAQDWSAGRRPAEPRSREEDPADQRLADQHPADQRPATPAPAAFDWLTPDRSGKSGAPETGVPNLPGERPPAGPETEAIPEPQPAKPGAADAQPAESQSAEPEPGEPESAKPEPGERGSGEPLRAEAEPSDQAVTVVPGVPRYHRSDCILIRFMGDNDLQKMPAEAAREAGCTPCRACQPDGEDVN